MVVGKATTSTSSRASSSRLPPAPMTLGTSTRFMLVATCAPDRRMQSHSGYAYYKPSPWTSSINLNTAKALGIEIPPSLLVRVDVNDTPVRFEPGRARLGTSPTPTGSFTLVNTIGIVAVVFLVTSATQTCRDRRLGTIAATCTQQNKIFVSRSACLRGQSDSARPHQADAAVICGFA